MGSLQVSGNMTRRQALATLAAFLLLNQSVEGGVEIPEPPSPPSNEDQMVEHCIETLKALPLEQAIEPARELMKALPRDTIDQILGEMDPESSESSESPESPEVDTHGWPGTWPGQ